MISDEALKEYKRIYKEEFNEEISDEKAIEEAVNLLTLFNVVYRPVKKEWLNEFPDQTVNKDKKIDDSSME